MRDADAKLLRAMIEARNAHEEASDAAHTKWHAFLKAQSAFTGSFAQTQHPLGPFICGDTLVEHLPNCDKWPEVSDQFRYRKVIRCPTSD